MTLKVSNFPTITESSVVESELAALLLPSPASCSLAPGCGSVPPSQALGPPTAPSTELSCHLQPTRGPTSPLECTCLCFQDGGRGKSPGLLWLEDLGLGSRLAE